ncbi:hypothetical protein JCM8547_005198 [Rhodosporidiobolus lusitaniae]
MRTTSLVLFSLASASLAVATPSEGGSIEALLERISQRQNATAAASARVSDVSDVPRNHTHLPPTPPPAAKDAAIEQPVPKKEDDEAPALKEGHKHESKMSAHNKMAKRVRAKADEELDKRYVWATGIIQDDTPSSAVPDVGANANLLSSSTTIPVNTPTAQLVAPSFPPKVTTTPAAASSTPHRRPNWKSQHKEEKRYVWSNQIIQEDTPDAPAVGANVNQLNTPAVALNTPSQAFVAPSFAPKASTSAKAAAAANPKRVAWHKAEPRAHDEHEEEKRWIQAGSIIQDDSPAEGLTTHTTPAATLVAPTFPPKLSSQTTPPAASTTSPAAVVEVVSSSVAAPASSTVSSAAPAAITTAAAHKQWWNPKVLWAEIEETFSKLFHLSSSKTAATTTTTAAVPASTGGVEKRYVWSNQILQDDTPADEAPALGANANLLSSSAPALTTPAAQLVAPSFPPKASSSAAASPAKVLAASHAASSPAAETTTAKPTVANARQALQQARAAAASAAAAKKAAAQAHTTTAAQKWYKAETKHQRMVKRERK